MERLKKSVVFLMKPKVTVGVCVRNCEDLIKETIDSIADQDFPHEFIELIIVDGSSEDKTLSILKENLKKTDLEYKILCENQGLGWARQLVVDDAGGDYIIWVDGDMVLSKDYVRKQVEFMERNPDVGVAKGKYGLTPGANWLATLEIYSRAASKMVDFNHRVKARSKSMGTSGCIYRVRVIRQVGGFDENIKGYGEDMDAEYRIRTAGWRLCTTDVQYLDYERHGLVWNDLWCKYLRRGYDMHYFLNKNKGIIKLYKMLPASAFLDGLLHSVKIYRLTRRKVVFLLPLQHVFKMTAWCLGFIRSSLDSHNHSSRSPEYNRCLIRVVNARRIE